MGSKKVITLEKTGEIVRGVTAPPSISVNKGSHNGVIHTSGEILGQSLKCYDCENLFYVKPLSENFLSDVTYSDKGIFQCGACFNITHRKTNCDCDMGTARSDKPLQDKCRDELFTAVNLSKLEENHVQIAKKLTENNES